MSNQDQFDMAMNRKDYRKAAELAIQFGSHKNSRSGAWRWSDEAVNAAKLAGITLDQGRLSWPDFDAMEKQLKAANLP